ncbi:hypothetical protein GTA08_BOTSDO05413 [Botryosphaeria dothidea]|uniref:Uncharacterized protein n=1 Tax=Botryosphaeria dothidea TaxID=55169 RepID=A0A8H4ITR6_9PEZI|nr:hypothetical protein GTA08_BOTSDO05413 [Botryosphaeria dothidea]
MAPFLTSDFSTYRERKEAYVRALETEILQLRSREAAIMQETQEIYAEINNLRRTLVANGIDPPAPLTQTNPKQSFKLTIEDYHGGRKICTQPEKDPLAKKHEKQTSFGTAIPSAPLDHEISLSDPERRQDPVCPTAKQLPPLPEQRTPRTQQAVANPSGQSSALASELDRTSAGIDFVLSLESPCLEHVENGLLDTAASHGHALTASATLLFNANQRSSPQNEPFRSWEASSVSLELYWRKWSAMV